MQLDLFGAPAPARAPACPHHGPEYVCDEEGLDTDHSGFVHRSLCAGRIALRRCMGCGNHRTPGTWNHADWFHCLDCVPLGQLSDMARPVAAALTEAKARPKKDHAPLDRDADCPYIGVIGGATPGRTGSRQRPTPDEAARTPPTCTTLQKGNNNDHRTTPLHGLQ